MPDRHRAGDAATLRRHEIERERDHIRDVSGRPSVEYPDTRLESEQREAALRVGTCRERALSQIVAAGEAEERLDPHVGVLQWFAALARDAAGNAIERL